MLCGAKQPAGHVVVYDENHARREGRLCSSHTFREVIMDQSDRFLVEVTVDVGPHLVVEVLERVHRKHGLLVPKLPRKRKPKSVAI